MVIHLWQLPCTDKDTQILFIEKRFNQPVSHNYWDHAPSAVVESPEVKILWDFNVYTDHVLAAQHSHIVVIDKHQNALQINDIPYGSKFQ